MKFMPSSDEVCLSDSRPVSLRQARGLRVTCTAGIVWITVTGEAGDIFLTPGQSHQISRNGLVVIESIGSGKIRLNKPEAAFALFRHFGKMLYQIGLGEKTGASRIRRFS